MSKPHDLSNFMGSIADLLRGPYRPPQYEPVMLPLVVLRRFPTGMDAQGDAIRTALAQQTGWPGR